MAKKQRRSSSSASRAAGVAAPSKRNMTAQEFNPDYTSVISDLKKIGIMAVSFTAILVILSFIIK